MGEDTHRPAQRGFILALGGALLGVPLAYAALRALVSVGPANIPRSATVGLDAQVLILALRVSATIALVFGVLPVLQARGTDVQTALKAQGAVRAPGAGAGRVADDAVKDT